MIRALALLALLACSSPPPTPACPAPPLVHRQTANLFYSGLTVWKAPPGPVDGYEFVWANRTARGAIPNLAAARAGQRPLDVFPSMRTEEGRAYFRFVGVAADTGVPVSIGSTSFGGIEWYSAIVPVGPDHAAVVFHPLEDVEGMDMDAGHAFSRQQARDAQLRHLEGLVEQAAQRLGVVDE